MKHSYLILPVLLLFTACIPYKIAPKIKGDHVQLAKKFHRKLPRQNAFIFEDTKDAGEFYDYLYFSLKPDPNIHPDDFAYNLPVNLDGTQAYLTFYEVERTSNTLNLIPFFIDAALQVNDHDPLLEDSYTSGTGHWYIVIILRDEQVQDMLNSNHKDYEKARAYLSALKKEYNSTTSYQSLLLTKD